MILVHIVINLVICAPENSKEAALEKVSGLDDTKVVQIAAGAEHSALVTGNVRRSLFIYISTSFSSLAYVVSSLNYHCR